MSNRAGMSPVLKADVKLFGDGPAFCVDVRFSSRRALRTLADMLLRLSLSTAPDPTHVHLQDANLRHNVSGTEVTFYRPGIRRDYAERLCVREAAKAIRGKPFNRATPLTGGGRGTNRSRASAAVKHQCRTVPAKES